jgi:hypothetical protein
MEKIMKKSDLVIGGGVAAVLIAVIFCIGMVTGFTTAKPFISVDPISDKNTGDNPVITGKTSLPAGTGLLIEAYPASLKDQTGTGSGEFTGATGTVTVAKGSGTANTWSWPLDTSTFGPGEYLVSVSTFRGDPAKGDLAKGDISASTTFILRQSPQSPAAATSNSPDDTVAAGIIIDPIRDTTAGQLLKVTGSTDLPVETDLIVKVIPASMDNATILRDYRAPENAAVVKVVKGTGNNNRFLISLDTRFLPPAQHIIFVSGMRDAAAGIDAEPAGWTGSALFNIIADPAVANRTGNSISEPSVFINPVPDVTAGETLTVTGTTNVPDGAEFMVLVNPEDSGDYNHPEFSATTTAVNGSGTVNIFSVTLPTKGLNKGNYIIAVSAKEHETTGTILFTVK